jgi:multimeric flavodoxin WrbA
LCYIGLNKINGGGENRMRKILLLLGSPRKHGNTAALAQAFSKGAAESGNQVTSYWLGEAAINPCKACDYCQRNNGECIQKDGMAELYPLLQSHDTLAIASPVYYLGLPGSIKNVIDRTYAESAVGRNIKYSVLLTAA